MQNFEALIQAIETAKINHTKFEAGNAAAGKRLRKSMAEAMKLAKAVRVDVLTIRESRKK